MKLIMICLIGLAAFTSPMSASSIDDPVSVGSISYRSAVWDFTYRIRYLKNNISDYTRNNRAVVLHFFYACLT